ncbi:MAG: hypothetical protein ACI9OJ_004245, partial [Myxococcota bacterium]
GDTESVTPAVAGETLDAAVRRNVAATLQTTHGLTISDAQTDVRWLDPPTGDLGVFDSTDVHVFVLLASREAAAPRDLYRLEARITPFGVVFDSGWVVNLTRTDGADDSALEVDGQRVATAVRYGGQVTAVEVRDLSGEDPVRAGTSDWSGTRLVGNRVTNLQETGTSRGLELDHYVVDTDGPETARLVFEGDRLHVLDDGASKTVATIDLATRNSAGVLAMSHLPGQQKMRYDFLNWLADTGRGFADQGLGPAWAGVGIELMKEAYFKAKEVQADIQEAEVADEPVVEEAPEVVEKAIERAKFQAEQSTLPWPPAPLDPMLEERAKGEGMWVEIADGDVTHQPNAPPPFFKTFIRPDPAYSRKVVWISVWDPAQVSLKMRAGTRNPVPQTGHRGDGRIPRDPNVLPKVVGGFNGGFQTAHIWYGMMVDKKVLLRPREYGATVGSWEDGRTAFGTWKPGAPIPDGLTHYRQNLPPLIEDGVFNPYKRRTWGWHKKVAGAVGGKTIRSSLCYTYDGYIMYFYSEFTDEHLLASTQFHCQCRYGIHLDMNRGHTGFEYYKLLEAGTPENAQASADETMTVEGFRFKGATLHPTIKHMKAPTRYLGVDYRDYFYLQLRAVVPGADLAALQDAALEGDGRWSTANLPHNAEFPPRLAETRLSTTGGGSIDVIQIDPRGVTVGPLADDHTALIATIPSPQAGPASLSIGEAKVAGNALDSDDKQPVERATAVGVGPDGFVFIALVRNASQADVAQIFQSRKISGGIWGSVLATAEPLVYQSVERAGGGTALTELSLRAQVGTVVERPRSDVPRLTIQMKLRPSRVVRLFPNMLPKQRKPQGRRK